jgi:hypothetical protein
LIFCETKELVQHNQLTVSRLTSGTRPEISGKFAVEPAEPFENNPEKTNHVSFSVGIIRGYRTGDLVRLYQRSIGNGQGSRGRAICDFLLPSANVVSDGGFLSANRRQYLYFILPDVPNG